MNILVVEDDELTCGLLKFLLENEGFAVSSVADAEGAQRLLQNRQFNLILLDIHLAGRDSGIDLCMQLRETGDQIPVIFVSGKNTTEDKVVGLRAGADDYVVKPFDVGELIERVKAVSRRHSFEVRNAPIASGNLQLDLQELKVTTPQRRDVPLTPTEVRVLHYLLLSNGRTVARETLMNSIWGHEYEGETNVVDVYIRRLREKIEMDPSGPRLIQTVRGVGYKLVT